MKNLNTPPIPKKEINGEKKPIYKKKRFWIILIIVMALFFGSGESSDNRTTSKAADMENTKEGVKKEKQKTYTADEESLKELYQDEFSMNSINNLKVEWDDINSCWHITYDFTGSAWDESMFIRQEFKKYIDYCKKAYKIEGVDSIYFTVRTEMQDSKGNNTTEDVFDIRMLKKDFDTYNWKNMEYKDGVFDQIQSDSDFFWIHPGILKNIDTEKDFYYS